MKRLFVSKEFLDSALNTGSGRGTVSLADRQVIAEEELRKWEGRADRQEDLLNNAIMIISLGIVGGLISFRAAADPTVLEILFANKLGFWGTIPAGNVLVALFLTSLFLQVIYLWISRHYAIPNLKKWLEAVRDKENPTDKDLQFYKNWENGRKWANRVQVPAQVLFVAGIALILKLIIQISGLEFSTR